MGTALAVLVGTVAGVFLGNWLVSLRAKPSHASAPIVGGPLVMRRQKERRKPKALGDRDAYLAELKEREQEERG